jgi:hypothetical protein
MLAAVLELLAAASGAAVITFTDVTNTAFVNPPALKGVSCSLGDIDRDGDLDLWLFNAGTIDDKLYRNDGTGHFEDITTQAGVAGTQGSGGEREGPLVDFNNDGLPDAYVCTALQGNELPNLLYVNTDGLHFEERGASFGVRSYVDTDGVFWADIDRDGFLDLYSASFPRSGFSNRPFLYMNQSGHVFVDSWAFSGLDFTGGGRRALVSSSTGKRMATRTCTSGRSSDSRWMISAIACTATTGPATSQRRQRQFRPAPAGQRRSSSPTSMGIRGSTSSLCTSRA